MIHANAETLGHAAPIPMKYIHGDIWCTYNKKEFVIEGTTIETSSGFRLQSIKRIRELQEAD